MEYFICKTWDGVLILGQIGRKESRAAYGVSKLMKSSGLQVTKIRAADDVQCFLHRPTSLI